MSQDHSGGRVIKVYGPGDLTPGASIPVTVGLGGAAAPQAGDIIPATPGTNGSVTIIWNESVLYNAVGTFTFIVPNYTSLTVSVAGASGGGGGGDGKNSGTGLINLGTDGNNASGNTTFQSFANLVAQPGAGGIHSSGSGVLPSNGFSTNGVSGAASGGTANVSGGGSKPGKGGSDWNGVYGGFGGVGGWTTKTFAHGDLSPGVGIVVKVAQGGAGGLGGGGSLPGNPGDAGANGYVNITWSGSGVHAFGVFMG